MMRYLGCTILSKKDTTPFLTITHNDIDKDRLHSFKEEHAHKNKYHGAIGGHITYNITPTSIGTMVSITCACCNVTEDITNLDEL